MEKKELLRTLKFVLFSASAGIVQTLTMILCEEVIKIPIHWVCYLIALVLSVLWNFTFNRRFTFQSAGNVPRAMGLVFLFYVFFAPASTLLTNFLADKKGWNEYVVLAICMVINLVLEYLWQNNVVFRNEKDTNALAKRQEEQRKESGIDPEQ